MKKVKVGVVGTGVMGEFHVRNYAEIKEAKLIGIYDPDADRAKAIAEKYGVVGYADLRTLQRQCEALSICSPTSTHFEIAMQCLKARKHILVEKPLAQTVEQAASLVEACRGTPLRLAVGMIERLNPAFQKALSLAKKEEILGIIAERFSPLPLRITDADVIDDMMVHDLDLCCLLANSDVQSLKATAQKIHTPNFDKAAVTLYFKSGLIAKVFANRTHTEKVRRMTITTTHAIYEADLLNKTLTRRDFEQMTDKAQIEIAPANQLQLELRDFLLAIEKKRDPETTGDEGYAIIKLIEEVRRILC